MVLVLVFNTSEAHTQCGQLLGIGVASALHGDLSEKIRPNT